MRKYREQGRTEICSNSKSTDISKKLLCLLSSDWTQVLSKVISCVKSPQNPISQLTTVKLFTGFKFNGSTCTTWFRNRMGVKLG